MTNQFTTHKYIPIEKHKLSCAKYQALLKNKHIPSLSFDMICDDCLLGKLDIKRFAYVQYCNLDGFIREEFL